MRVGEFFELPARGGDDVGMPVAQAGNRGAAGGIDIAAAMPVIQTYAFAADCDFQRLAGIAMENVCHGINRARDFNNRFINLYARNIQINIIVEFSIDFGVLMARKPHPPQTLDELVALVKARFPEMSPQFQVGARHLLDSPAAVPVESMRRIAARAGVQPATLVRLAQSLGYEGWEPLRQVFVRGLHQMPRRYADQARDTLRRRHAGSVLERQVAIQADNLRLLETQNVEGLPEAAKLLSKARHVHIAGFRASHAAAHTLHYLYRLFRNSVSLLRGDAGMLEMELRTMERADAAVIFGFAPYSQEAMRVAAAAHAHGCAIIAVCDSKLAPMAQNAAVTLLFPTATSSFFPSSAGATVLAEALAAQLLGRAGPKAIEALGRAEDELRNTGAYLDAQPPTTAPL